MGSNPTLSAIPNIQTLVFGRKLGVDAILGNGTTQPQGLYTAMQAIGPSYTTANSGKIVNTDITSIFFALNRA